MPLLFIFSDASGGTHPSNTSNGIEQMLMNKTMNDTTHSPEMDITSLSGVSPKDAETSTTKPMNTALNKESKSRTLTGESFAMDRILPYNGSCSYQPKLLSTTVFSSNVCV